MDRQILNGTIKRASQNTSEIISVGVRHHRGQKMPKNAHAVTGVMEGYTAHVVTGVTDG